MARQRKEREAPEVGAASARMMRALVRRAADGELEAVEELARLQAVLDACLHEAVQGYRNGPAEASWADVGRILGTTRQSAQARFGHAQAVAS
jgi:hypothetical protein